MDISSSSTDARPVKTRRKWYSRALLFLVLGFVGWAIAQHFNEIITYGMVFSHGDLALGIGCALLGYLAYFAIWTQLAAAFGLKENLLTTGKVWFLSRMGRHVPGKVAILLVRFDLYKNHPNNAITAATITEHIATTAAGGLLVTFAVTWGAVPVPLPWKILSAFLSLGLLLSLSPKIMPVLIGILFRAIKREPPAIYPSYSLVLRFVGAYCIPALFHGAAFFFLINALHHVDLKYFIVIAAVYHSAALIGMAALFAPAGIGVREGIIYLVLPILVPEPVVIAAAVGMRLVDTCSEAFLGGLFWALVRLRDKRKSI